MSELRHDPISRRWVIIATERSRRPEDFLQPAPPAAEPRFCPFCPGYEDKTPPEITAIRPPGSPPNTPGWDVRVIPNKYPALAIEGDLDRRAIGMYDRMRGIGAHEVVIESPHHNAHLGDIDPAHYEKVLLICQDRLRDLQRDRRFKYMLIFKNHGVAAGATLSHPHTQIIATPVTPRAIANELEAAHAHFHLKERCIYCDLLVQELESRERIVGLDEHFVVLAPYASRFPFEMLVMPRRHCHSFADEPRPVVAALSRCLRDLMARLKSVLRDPPFNFVFHTAPNTNTLVHRRNYWDTLQVDFHWHIEVLPRLTRVAGFEWGTGFYINPTSPEEAAAFLREALL
jgi:UDPglucose--hexose-1-phosphate uridylyltransferase